LPALALLAAAALLGAWSASAHAARRANSLPAAVPAPAPAAAAGASSRFT